MYSSSETQIYQASASSNNGKHKYAFQRVNRNSNGTTTFIAIRNTGDDIYTVVQATKDKEGRVKKRMYQMGANYIPSLMKANKDELANDLTKVVSLPTAKKKTTATKKKTTATKKKATTTTKKATTTKKKATATKKKATTKKATATTKKATTKTKKATTKKATTTTKKKTAKKSSGIFDWLM